jgi:hypothetical protein
LGRHDVDWHCPVPQTAGIHGPYAHRAAVDDDYAQQGVGHAQCFIGRQVHVHGLFGDIEIVHVNRLAWFSIRHDFIEDRTQWLMQTLPSVA